MGSDSASPDRVSASGACGSVEGTSSSVYMRFGCVILRRLKRTLGAGPSSRSEFMLGVQRMVKGQESGNAIDKTEAQGRP